LGWGSLEAGMARFLGEFEARVTSIMPIWCVLSADDHWDLNMVCTEQVVADDGAVLSCAMNAACAALVDAAVPMKHLFGEKNLHQHVFYYKNWN
jgi:exosome complex component RRP46